MASGPYLISDINPGKSITYKRNPDYWAKDHPVRKGMYNFDEITIKYYKDPVVALEAFKAGEFDFMSVNIAKQWVRDMEGDKFKSGKIIKKLFPHDNNAGLQGFLMNTRKPLFQTERYVRPWALPSILSGPTNLSFLINTAGAIRSSAIPTLLQPACQEDLN